VLLDTFNSYRRGINPYDKGWKKKHAWIRLTDVGRKWRGVVFASTSRLNLGITVGPTKPGHIKTILSSTLPIFIDYKYVNKDFGSALWRMRAALKHRDRGREISLEGIVEFEDKFFGEFFKATQCTFPVLESLSLCFGNNYQPNLPNTFLRGPDLSNPHLRHLKLERATLASISGFLLSATALTDLILQVGAAFSPSTETSLLACLQGMPCLCSLDLSLAHKSPSQPPTPKDIVPLSKLTYFHFVGSSVDLEALAAGLSAPSLRDVNFKFRDEIWPPIVHLPRFNDEIEKSYYAVWMVFEQNDFCLSLWSKSEYFIQCEPSFNFGPVRKRNPESIIQMSDALSTRLTTGRYSMYPFSQRISRSGRILFRGAGSFGGFPVSRCSGQRAQMTTLGVSSLTCPMTTLIFCRL
jgi:hypothetical protein